MTHSEKRFAAQMAKLGLAAPKTWEQRQAEKAPVAKPAHVARPTQRRDDRNINGATMGSDDDEDAWSFGRTRE